MFIMCMPSMFLPNFLNSFTRCTVLPNDSNTRAVVASTPPDADLYNCQSAQQTTNVLGTSSTGFVILDGFHLRTCFLISSISTVDIAVDSFLLKVALYA